MLNISKNSISHLIGLEDFESYNLLRKHRIKRLTLILLSILMMLVIVGLFLPWTQNIRAKGKVTTLRPEQRPQEVQSIISGRVEKWFVREGDQVKKGDTLVFLSEIQTEYFDPQIVERTSQQLTAKEESINSYQNKLNALRQQQQALAQALEVKKSQVENKILQTRNQIVIDSVNLIAETYNLDIAKNQLERITTLHEQGLKTLSELQEKQNKYQLMTAKVNAVKNKFANKKNEEENLQLELIGLEREYAEKMSKVQSDIQSALTGKLDAIGSSSKLANDLTNYSERQKYQYITAPQDGYVTNTLKKGIGETIKAGASIATIMPSNYQLAVEAYIKPVDVPLIKLGQEVQIRFDGWPAIVISGWPEGSTGIFQGSIISIDRYLQPEGHYRIFVEPKEVDKTWPKELGIGSGAQTFILLKDVPIWYEIWRQLNGFPPDFYTNTDNPNPELKLKAPIKSIK